MAAISTSVSPPRGSTKRFGRRRPITSINGSSASASCITIRVCRRWRRSRWSSTSSESPSPEWMLSTTTGRSRADSAASAGSDPRIVTRTRATRNAVRASVPTNQRSTA